MRRALPLLWLVPVAALAAPSPHFELTASFVPAKKPRGNASVAVRFQPLDPDVVVKRGQRSVASAIRH